MTMNTGMLSVVDCLTSVHLTVSELTAELREKEGVLAKINEELENLNEFKVSHIFS